MLKFGIDNILTSFANAASNDASLQICNDGNCKLSFAENDVFYNNCTTVNGSGSGAVPQLFPTTTNMHTSHINPLLLPYMHPFWSFLSASTTSASDFNQQLTNRIN